MSNKLNELRPFDLEAAKAGALVTDPSDEMLWSYVAGPDASGKFVMKIEAKDIGTYGEFTYPSRPDFFRMKPLCWVEDRPVYKGDVLWNKNHPDLRYDVDYVSEYGTVVTVPNETDSYSEHPEKLTWTRPHLCLVEGRPVHVGSVLFSKDGDEVTVEGLWSNGDIRTTHGIRCGCVRWTADYLSWTKPVRKVKKEAWLNVYSGDEVVTHRTKELADECATDQRKACVHIEWEEEA